MRLLFYADPHFSQYSSIVRERGYKHSVRLEYLIKSLNWVESFPDIDQIVCLGDFFDKPILNAEEITAIKEINFSDKPHYYISGNHCIASNDLEISSINMLKGPHSIIVAAPLVQEINDYQFVYVPYQLGNKRTEISTLLDNLNVSRDKKIVILSHNDLKGIQMGGWKTTSGLDINDIESSCDLFLNGHLHNKYRVSSKVLNVGNLCGKNFNEDCSIYKHGIHIFDTASGELEFVENPYALNFLKFDFTNSNERPVYSNLVLSAVCYKDQVPDIERFYNDLSVATIFVIKQDDLHNDDCKQTFSDLQSDHLQEFKKFIIEKLGDSKDVINELQEVLS